MSILAFTCLDRDYVMVQIIYLLFLIQRQWDTVNQQGLTGSKSIPSHRTVKRTFSGVLQLPRLSRRLSAQGDSENTPRKASFCLGVANGLESETCQSS